MARATPSRLVRAVFATRSGTARHLRVGAVVFVLALVPRLGFLLYRGPRFGGDTAGYLRTCSLYATQPLEALQSLFGILYAGFTIPFCGVWALTGRTAIAWVAIQITLSALGCVLLYDIGRRLFGTAAGLVSASFAIVLLQAFRYDVLLLSDSLFVFLVTLSIWAIGTYQLEPTRTRRIFAWLCVLYMAFTRPFGLPILIGWLVYDVVTVTRDHRIGLVPDSRLVSGIVAAVAVVTTLVLGWSRIVGESVGKSLPGHIFAGAYPFTYPFALREGQTFLHFLLLNVHHVLALGVLRVGVFLSPYTPQASTVYNVLNAVTFGPLVICGLLGAKRLVDDRSAFAPLVVLPVVMVLLVVALTYISYGGRFRAYVVPPLALAAGYYLASVGLPATVRSAIDRQRTG